MEDCCSALIEFGDRYYGTPYGLWCEREKGHSGNHEVSSEIVYYPRGRGVQSILTYTLTWDGNMSRYASHGTEK